MTNHSIKLYKTLPNITITKGDGPWLFDSNGKKYLDGLCCFSADNFGHCNRRIREAMYEQSGKIALPSQFLEHDKKAPAEAMICKDTGYGEDGAVIFMNTGAEIVETAIKDLRHYGHRVRGIPKGECKIVFFRGNFHGRTPGALAASSDPDVRADFDPFLDGMIIIPFNDLEALKNAFQDENVVGLIMEPIQGENGVIIPSPGFIRGVRQLCDEFNKVFIADEIQTAMGRTGKILACQHENVLPDITLLGKSIGGGLYPVSVAVGYRPFMDVFEPGEHGSTFAANAISCVVAMEALNILREDDICNKVLELRTVFLNLLESMDKRALSLITAIRGIGLMFAIDLDISRVNSWDFICRLAKNGVICKNTHNLTIRFSPSLIVEKKELLFATQAIEKTLLEFI